jgi:hypothetical protein
MRKEVAELETKAKSSALSRSSLCSEYPCAPFFVCWNCREAFVKQTTTTSNGYLAHCNLCNNVSIVIQNSMIALFLAFHFGWSCYVDWRPIRLMRQFFLVLMCQSETTSHNGHSRRYHNAVVNITILNRRASLFWTPFELLDNVHMWHLHIFQATRLVGCCYYLSCRIYKGAFSVGNPQSTTSLSTCFTSLPN